MNCVRSRSPIEVFPSHHVTIRFTTCARCSETEQPSYSADTHGIGAVTRAVAQRVTKSRLRRLSRASHSLHPDSAKTANAGEPEPTAPGGRRCPNRLPSAHAFRAVSADLRLALGLPRGRLRLFARGRRVRFGRTLGRLGYVWLSRHPLPPLLFFVARIARMVATAASGRRGSVAVNVPIPAQFCRAGSMSI